MSDDGEENEEDAFEFTITESTTPIPVSLDASEISSLTASMVNNLKSHSMVPLVDAPEHEIMPLGRTRRIPAS